MPCPWALETSLYSTEYSVRSTEYVVPFQRKYSVVLKCKVLVEGAWDVSISVSMFDVGVLACG